MALSVYGKHPAKGDFLDHGVPAALRGALEGWLDAVLAEAQSGLGADWAQVWRDAPMLRFWIGEAVWGMPLAGVMAASQDRVGRRFPLVIFCTGPEAAMLPAPTIGDDAGWYDAMAAHLAAKLGQSELASPADLLTGALPPAVVDGQPEPGPAAFWAVRPGAALDALFADIALTDHRRAAAGRSYWWVAGEPVVAAADTGPVAVDEPLPVEPVAADGPAVVDGPAAADEPAEADGPAAAEPVGVEGAAEIGVAQPEIVADDTALWDVVLPDRDQEEGSPFAQGAGLSLFAAPEAADPMRPVAAPVAPVAMAAAVPRRLWSQVWAGAGLPGGAVLAWFLRGVTDNG